MTPKYIAQEAIELKEALHRGNITIDEFKELVKDLIIAESVNNKALELEENIQYRAIIVSVIDLAIGLS